MTRRSLLALAAVLGMLFALLPLTAASAVTQVLINEVDADQSGTDAAEFVELFDGGVGNTDLSGMSLVFYNGSDDLSYRAYDLDGQSTNGSGYFVLCGNAGNTANCDLDVSPDTDLIQNGQDAVVLLTGNAVDFPNDSALPADGDILDAIVYDTDDGDDAALLVLLNAGQPQINERGGGDGTAHSNQRCANGTGGARNTDTYAQWAPTPGAENTCAAPPAAVVLINEVDADQSGTDAAEFVELFDGGVGNTDLSGLSLVFYNGSDDLSYRAYDLDGQSTNGSGYFVLCGNAGNTANCDLDVSPDTDLIQNGQDAVVLLTGNAVDFPNDSALPADGDILDAIVYDTDDGDDAALLVLLNAGQPQINERGGGDGTAHSNQRCANGTGGARNTDTYAQWAPTPGAENTCAAPPAAVVLINEVDADQSGTDAAEFVELFDGGVGNTDLSGLSLVFYNGSDDLSYRAYDLDGQSTNGSGYFVLCGNAGNTANCDLDVSPDTDLIQNGQDAVVLLTGNAVDFPNDSALPADGDILDAIVYDTDDGDDAALLVLLNAGQPQINERGGGDGTAHSNQRCANGTGGARNTDTYAQWAPTPGAENVCELAAYAAFIHEVQGPGATSPIVGDAVILEAVVVGDFQGGSPALNGIFIQEEDADADADPMTSEGIFVYLGGFGPDVNVGDHVRVTGTVQEYFDQTQIGGVTELTKTDVDALFPTPATVTLPVASLDVWEYVEGMSLTIPTTLSVTETYSLGRYGEVELSSGGPLDNPTNVAAPGAAAAAVAASNVLRRIQLDDANTWQNISPTSYLHDANVPAGEALRIGDTVVDLTGVLGYSFGAYEIQPTGTVEFDRTNPRPAGPPSVGGNLTVASFNVLNYFSTIDTGASICGPGADQGCRGADSANEFTRQRTKIIQAIVKLDADVVGLMEIENHATDDALKDLVAGLNTLAGAGTYARVDAEPVGDDVIKVAIIYKPASVTPVGAYKILDNDVDPTFNDDKNRAVLAQTFEDVSTGGKFTVAVNHLKSKGSNCDSLGDPDADDGQGNCNLTREKAAKALVNWLATDPTGSGDADMLIIGDLNAYAKEDPITAITAAGYTDLIRTFRGVGVAQDAYSYVFAGELGYLDHGLANASMLSQITGAAFWHTNANEAIATDYNEEFNDPPNYNGLNEFRASDHDAVVIGIAVGQLQPSGSIGDLVWYDCAVTDVTDPTCANAVQDSGELGIENAKVTITGLDGQDVDPNTGGLQTTLSMLTNVNGNYTFSGLPYGNYKVQVLISDVPDPSDRSLRFTTASSYALLLPDGGDVVSADFGVIADTLPDTGLKTDQVLVMAIVLLLVGSLAVLFARRKEEDYLTEMAA